MRLFLAVGLPPEAADRVSDLRRKIERAASVGGLRWVKPAQVHFTLKFLGEQPEESVRLVGEAAREAAKKAAPFSISLQGLGGFPSSQRPRTLWIGARAGTAEMTALAAALDALLAERGFAKEQRPFAAHLTIARAKARADETAAARAIECAPAGEIAAFRATSFALMQSVSTPEGVKYVLLDSFELA
jgi:RNA 2',3'-cyclic 3'-phosphodiesterase